MHSDPLWSSGIFTRDTTPTIAGIDFSAPFPRNSNATLHGADVYVRTNGSDQAEGTTNDKPAGDDQSSSRIGAVW